MDPHIDPSADALAIGPRLANNGADAFTAHNASARLTAKFAIESVSGNGATPTVATGADHDSTLVLLPMLRAGSLALVAFQIAYTVLDRVEYPLTFARTAPLHIASVVVGLIALTITLSSRTTRNWRAFSILVYALIIAGAARIAVLNSDSDVLVALIVLFFFGGGALLPWSPRWQAALEAIGAIALLGYSRAAAAPDSREAIAWMTLASAAVLSHVSSVHGSRSRQRLDEQLAALAENDRLLRREMALREEIAAARERDHLRLQTSETMLRKMFEASPDNIAVNSLADGRFIAVNDEYEVAGYTRDDVIGNSIIALGMWPDEQQMNLFLDKIKATGRVKNMEIAQRRKDGDLETHLISASVIEANGEPCVMSMTRDITEIKRVETHLRASHAALRKIFDATLDIIVVTRLSDGAYIDFNHQFERFGYGQKDLDDSRKGQRQIWASEEQHQELRARILAEGVVRNMEVDFLLPDGRLMPALLAAVRVELEGEDCVVSMIRDLTAAKEASRKLEASVEALSASEETFRKLFDANLDSMTLGAVTGAYIDVNQEFIKTTGYSREEAVGHHFTDLNMWIHPDEMIRFADQLTRTDEVRNLEVAFRMKDGSEQPVLLSAVNLDLHGQKCCLTICRSIADVKMTQRELVAAREAALAASRAKSEFLSSMSHEIRTPMNSILGMADLLMETDLGDEQRRYLRTVISNGHALLELINSILDLAKVESGRLSLEAVEFNPRDVAEKVLETLAIRADERDLDLMLRFAPDVPELALGDPLRLSQILINLVGNAIKFTHQGQVLVTVERDPETTAAASAAVGLKFTVSDTGIGILADKRDFLFKPFSQGDSSTSRKYGGSGLGLAIVSRLVALMRGKVTVESEPGIGSAFSFTAQFAAAVGPAPSESSDRPLAGTKVLLVDDNADARSIVAELLATRGAQVTEASSAAGALAELYSDRARASHFQIVLLDGAMPARGSFEVAEYVTAVAHGHPRIVVMAGSRDLALEVVRLRAIGVDNYVVKPVRRAELFAAVARAGAGETTGPRGDRSAKPAVTLSSDQPAIVERPLEILLADDSSDNRALIRAYLKKTPYHLEEVEDGLQAIEKFIAGKFDVVLMDIQMPNVDGYEATAAIRGWERTNNRRRTPILALTASALDDAMIRTKAAGCDAHITKPVKKATLLEAIRNALKNTRPDDDRENVAILKEEACRTE